MRYMSYLQRFQSFSGSTLPPQFYPETFLNNRKSHSSIVDNHIHEQRAFERFQVDCT